jgi:hypothetical protein
LSLWNVRGKVERKRLGNSVMVALLEKECTYSVPDVPGRFAAPGVGRGFSRRGAGVSASAIVICLRKGFGRGA